MSAIIHWNTFGPQDWQAQFARLERTTLPQSYAYALAVCPRARQRARWGLIEINGRAAGMVQVQEAGILRNALHALIIDRGPLWFEGFGGTGDFDAFMAALTRRFPRRIGRKYRIIPEMPDGVELDALMRRYGFQKTGAPYETIWLDLRPDEDVLRRNLRKNWRGALNKAEQNGEITMDWSLNTAGFKDFLKNYAQDKTQKGYGGASVDMVMALAKTFVPGGNMLLGRALSHRQVLGSVLVLKHGRSATYQIGWTSAQGRAAGAQNLLLWRAALELKQQGITGFDLGGINDDTAKGVQQFKQGMGGVAVRLGAVYG